MTVKTAARFGFRLDPATDTGLVGDNITQGRQVRLSGFGPAGAHVAFVIQGDNGYTRVFTQIPVKADGTFALRDLSLADGHYTIRLFGWDQHGTTIVHAPSQLIIDNTPPAAPTFDSATLVTGDTHPLLSGRAEAGAKVLVYVDGGTTPAGTVTADASGHWTYKVGPALTQAAHTVSAIAVDAAGNASGPSATGTLTVAPATTSPTSSSSTTSPVISSSAPSSSQPGKSGATALGAPVLAPFATSLTNVTKPVVHGTAAANAMVTVYADGVTKLGTTKADSKGNWSVTPAAALADGQHSFTATASDNAGHVSPASSPLALTIDATPPAAPVVSGFAASLTSNVLPLVKGTAEANASVTVSADGKAIGTVQADATGAWSLTPATALADGTHSFTAQARDAAGNVGALSTAVSLTIDHTAPAAPVIAGFGTTLTSATTPVVSGSAEANALVTVFADGKVIGTIQANGAGAWSLTPATALADGTHSFTAQARDAAGNVGALSTAVSLTIDHTAPAAPVIAGFGTALTSATTPVVSGSAEANALVTVFADGATLGTIQANATGAWSLTPATALADGTHSFTAQARDAAGNVGALSTAVSLTIDHTAPAAPVIASFASPYTSSTTPSLHGTAEANAMVALYLDGATTAMGSARADASGTWSFTPATPLLDGTHRFAARATDSVGNVGALSASVAVTIDHLAPLAPIIAAFGQSLTNDSTPNVQGSAEAGSTVSVIVDGAAASAAKVVADASGHWSLDLAPLADGTHVVTATATDLAGNVSAVSGGQSVTIDTHAPAALVSSLVVAGDNIISATEAAAASLHVTGTLSQTLQAGDSLLVTMAGSTFAVAASAIQGTSFGFDVVKPAGGWTSGIATAHVEDAAHNAAAATTDAYSLAPVTSPASTFLLGVNIAGGEFGKLGDQYGWGYIYPSHGEVDYYSSKGMDVIRVPFLWDRLQTSQFAALDPTELSRMDDVVNYATSHGLKVVLDPHNYGYGSTGLIGSGTSDAAFADFWGKMAAHYAGNSNVIFGLMNEPNQQTATSWLGSANAAIAAIRAAGATNEILVPGTAWDGAWTWTTTDNAKVIGAGVQDPLHNFAFEVHQYLDTWGSGTESTVVSTTIGVERLTAVTQWAESTGNKLFLGEFGVATDQTSLTALDKMLTYMQQHTDAWQGGTYWAGGAWWGNYMYSVEPNAGVDKPQMAILQQHANQVV